MPSFFEKETYDELQKRLHHLTPDSERVWGKMDAGQMLKHCQFPIQIALSKEKVELKPNWLIKTFFKKLMYAKMPYSKGAPTAPALVVKESKNFKAEKASLQRWMDELWEDRDNANRRPHPIFGEFTKEQWGTMQWKHLDHHFRQFGV